MKKFVPLLRKINQKLELPQPIKSRIILEMAADLNDLYETYRSKGLNEEEAALKAEEKFDASDETLSELAKVHATGFQKLLNRMSQRTQTTWERFVLIFMILSMVVYSSQTIFKTSFVQNSSIFVYPVSILFLAIIVISIKKFYQLFIKKEHNLKTIQSGINLILLFGALNIFIGVFGYSFEMFVSGGHGEMFVPFLLIIINTTFPEAFQLLINIVNTMMKTSSLMMCCILVTMLTAFVWFGLSNKVSTIEQAEALFLLQE